MLETAEDEEYIQDLEKQLEAIELKMTSSKNNDLMRFKDEISQVLESEIVTRYFYQEGSLASAIKYDDEVLQAIDLLNNPLEFEAILKGDTIK